MHVNRYESTKISPSYVNRINQIPIENSARPTTSSVSTAASGSVSSSTSRSNGRDTVRSNLHEIEIIVSYIF